jgi:rRNA-processing protein FCF1
MDVVVSDTNIFIDLYSIDLLNEFFALPFHIHTVDFVINEITEEIQKKTVLKFAEQKKLIVKTHSGKELQEINEFSTSCKGNLSFVDCSVWRYAQINQYRLLTGDKRLRSQAMSAGVTVAGIIYIFDQFVEHGLLSPADAAEKLEILLKYNNRLPKREIEARLSKWRK